MQLRRQMVEQKGEGVVDRLSRDEVIIVENENVEGRPLWSPWGAAAISLTRAVRTDSIGGG